MKCFLVLVGAALSWAGAEESTPADVARAFYGEYQKAAITGLPGPATARIAPYLSAPLLQALTRAQREQDRCKRAHPDEKEPWVEGDLFSSDFEGFQTFSVEDAPPNARGTARLKITFTHSENGHKISWTDQVSLVQVKGRWLVDDVFYGGTGGAFGSGFGQSLRKALSGKGC